MTGLPPCQHGVTMEGYLQTARAYVVMCWFCAKILRVPRRLNRKPNLTRRSGRTDFARGKRRAFFAGGRSIPVTLHGYGLPNASATIGDVLVYSIGDRVWNAEG